MLGQIIAAVIVGYGVWSMMRDLSRGESYVSARRNGQGAWIRKSEMPLLFFTVVSMKILMALLFAALFSGWFMIWIQWTI